MSRTRQQCHISLKLLLLCGFFCQAGHLCSQADTLKLYKDMRRAAYKHKVTRWIYDGIFVNPVPQKYDDKPLSDEQRATDPKAAYTGRIIRNIRVIVYDPFGHSVNDETHPGVNGLQKIGNSLHITTRKRVIRNVLLFKRYDTVALFNITESERLLRAMAYVNDARIFVSGPAGSDSADILVKVLDRWNLDGSISASMTGGYVRIRDKNLGGFGQTYQQVCSYSTDGSYLFSGDYNVSNLRNTFISSDLYYSTTQDDTRAGARLNRGFYSPIARWAGGVEASRTWSSFKYTDTTEKADKKVPLNYYNTDYWLARSFALGKKKNAGMNSNIITGARYSNAHYLDRPSFDLDTNYINVNTNIYLGSIGYSLRTYYKDQFIYRFGANEDVPEGVLVQFTSGIVDKEILSWRYYSGFDLSGGKHFKHFGYLSAGASYGTLHRPGYRFNSTLNGALSYFSNLYRGGHWYFRNFVNYKMVYGLNKQSYERITLNPAEMYGFNPGAINGTEKMILNVEMVAYAPYNIIGFKFAPVLLAGLGVLGNQGSSMLRKDNTIYQAYSVGMLIRNENLLNSSFEFSVGFYPQTPDGKYNTFKLNPVGSFSLKVRSFDIGQPSTAGFN